MAAAPDPAAAPGVVAPRKLRKPAEIRELLLGAAREVFGSKGMAASENPLANATIVRTAEGMRAATLPYFFLDRYVPSYLNEWEAFVSAVATGTEPVVGKHDARAPLVIGLAAWRSLREGQPCSLR